MTTEIVPFSSRRQLSRAGFRQLPGAIGVAGEDAAWRFIDFFTSNIRNENTRMALLPPPYPTHFTLWSEMTA